MDPKDAIKILLVDDRPSNLLALEMALASPEYQLVSARSGAEALRFLLKEECALILMDVNMPELDGYETARLIRQNERTRAIPIVFITAFAEDEARVLEGYESGAIDHLRKPVLPEVLRSKVAGFAALHRARVQIERQGQLLREHEQREHAHALAQLELRSLRRQQAAQRRYQTLVEGLSQAIVWVLDPVTRGCTFASPSAVALLGFEPERWTSEPGFWLERVVPEHRQRVADALAGLAPGGQAAVVEHGLLRSDGQPSSFQTTLRLLPGDDPGRLEVHGLSVDVTQAVEARGATAFLAHASDELSRSLDVQEIAQRAVGLAAGYLGEWCLVEVDGRAAVASHAQPALRAAAQAAAEALSVHGLRATPCPALLEAPFTFLAGAPRAPGLPPSAGALLLPLVARGSRLGTVCLFSDDRAALRGRRGEAAEEFARRLAQAVDNALLHAKTEAAVAAREQFLSIASHELRTPLTALHLQVEMLRHAAAKRADGAPPDDALERRLAVLGRQVERMTALVNALLDLARIRSERLSLEVAPCDLGEVVRDAAARFDVALGKSQRSLCVEVARGLVGRWDRTRLEQLVSNLIGNAVKHGGTGPITVRADRAGAAAVLTVSDTGPGIPPQEQARIFQPFEQGKNAGHGGLGLGLYIARGIAEAHGGRLSLTSAVGRGTTFQIELPLLVEVGGAVDRALPQPAASA